VLVAVVASVVMPYVWCVKHWAGHLQVLVSAVMQCCCCMVCIARACGVDGRAHCDVGLHQHASMPRGGLCQLGGGHVLGCQPACTHALSAHGST